MKKGLVFIGLLLVISFFLSNNLVIAINVDLGLKDFGPESTHPIGGYYKEWRITPTINADGFEVYVNDTPMMVTRMDIKEKIGGYHIIRDINQVITRREFFPTENYENIDLILLWGWMPFEYEDQGIEKTYAGITYCGEGILCGECYNEKGCSDDNTKKWVCGLTFPTPTSHYYKKFFTDCVSGHICNNGDCIPIVCGNSVVELGEECDDGNTNPGDGCSSSCLNETCKDYITNDTCLAIGNDCTWTPPRKEYPEAGCCFGGQADPPIDAEEWDSDYEKCGSTANLCYLPFNIGNIITTKEESDLTKVNIRFDRTPAQYCAKVFSTGINYGFWYNTETY